MLLPLPPPALPRRGAGEPFRWYWGWLCSDGLYILALLLVVETMRGVACWWGSRPPVLRLCTGEERRREEVAESPLPAGTITVPAVVPTMLPPPPPLAWWKAAAAAAEAPVAAPLGASTSALRLSRRFRWRTCRASASANPRRRTEKRTRAMMARACQDSRMWREEEEKKLPMPPPLVGLEEGEEEDGSTAATSWFSWLRSERDPTSLDSSGMHLKLKGKSIHLPILSPQFVTKKRRGNVFSILVSDLWEWESKKVFFSNNNGG